MSIQNVRKFYEQVSKDKLLKDEIAKIDSGIQIKQIQPEDLSKIVNEKIIPLAKKNGYDFSEADLFKYLEEKLRVLDITDLDQISGGISQRAVGFGLGAVMLLGLGGTGVINLMKGPSAYDGTSISQSVEPNDQGRNANEKEAESFFAEQSQENKKKIRIKPGKNEPIKGVKKAENIERIRPKSDGVIPHKEKGHFDSDYGVVYAEKEYPNVVDSKILKKQNATITQHNKENETKPDASKKLKKIIKKNVSKTNINFNDNFKPDNNFKFNDNFKPDNNFKFNDNFRPDDNFKPDNNFRPNNKDKSLNEKNNHDNIKTRFDEKKEKNNVRNNGNNGLGFDINKINNITKPHGKISSKVERVVGNGYNTGKNILKNIVSVVKEHMEDTGSLAVILGKLVVPLGAFVTETMINNDSYKISSEVVPFSTNTDVSSLIGNYNEIANLAYDDKINKLELMRKGTDLYGADWKNLQNEIEKCGFNTELTGKSLEIYMPNESIAEYNGNPLELDDTNDTGFSTSLYTNSQLSKYNNPDNKPDIVISDSSDLAIKLKGYLDSEKVKLENGNFVLNTDVNISEAFDIANVIANLAKDSSRFEKAKGSYNKSIIESFGNRNIKVNVENGDVTALDIWRNKNFTTVMDVCEAVRNSMSDEDDQDNVSAIIKVNNSSIEFSLDNNVCLPDDIAQTLEEWGFAVNEDMQGFTYNTESKIDTEQIESELKSETISENSEEITNSAEESNLNFAFKAALATFITGALENILKRAGDKGNIQEEPKVGNSPENSESDDNGKRKLDTTNRFGESGFDNDSETERKAPEESFKVEKEKEDQNKKKVAASRTSAKKQTPKPVKNGQNKRNNRNRRDTRANTTKTTAPTTTRKSANSKELPRNVEANHNNQKPAETEENAIYEKLKDKLDNIQERLVQLSTESDNLNYYWDGFNKLFKEHADAFNEVKNTLNLKNGYQYDEAIDQYTIGGRTYSQLNRYQMLNSHLNMAKTMLDRILLDEKNIEDCYTLIDSINGLVKTIQQKQTKSDNEKQLLTKAEELSNEFQEKINEIYEAAKTDGDEGSEEGSSRTGETNPGNIEDSNRQEGRENLDNSEGSDQQEANSDEGTDSSESSSSERIEKEIGRGAPTSGDDEVKTPEASSSVLDDDEEKIESDTARMNQESNIDGEKEKAPEVSFRALDYDEGERKEEGHEELQGSEKTEKSETYGNDEDELKEEEDKGEGIDEKAAEEKALEEAEKAMEEARAFENKEQYEAAGAAFERAGDNYVQAKQFLAAGKAYEHAGNNYNKAKRYKDAGRAYGNSAWEYGMAGEDDKEDELDKKAKEAYEMLKEKLERENKDKEDQEITEESKDGENNNNSIEVGDFEEGRNQEEANPGNIEGSSRTEEANQDDIEGSDQQEGRANLGEGASSQESSSSEGTEEDKEGTEINSSRISDYASEATLKSEADGNDEDEYITSSRGSTGQPFFTPHCSARSKKSINGEIDEKSEEPTFNDELIPSHNLDYSNIQENDERYKQLTGLDRVGYLFLLVEGLIKIGDEINLKNALSRLEEVKTYIKENPSIFQTEEQKNNCRTKLQDLFNEIKFKLDLIKRSNEYEVSNYEMPSPPSSSHYDYDSYDYDSYDYNTTTSGTSEWEPSSEYISNYKYDYGEEGSETKPTEDDLYSSEETLGTEEDQKISEIRENQETLDSITANEIPKTGESQQRPEFNLEATEKDSSGRIEDNQVVRGGVDPEFVPTITKTNTDFDSHLNSTVSDGRIDNTKSFSPDESDDDISDRDIINSTEDDNVYKARPHVQIGLNEPLRKQNPDDYIKMIGLHDNISSDDSWTSSETSDDSSHSHTYDSYSGSEDENQKDTNTPASTINSFTPDATSENSSMDKDDYSYSYTYDSYSGSEDENQKDTNTPASTINSFTPDATSENSSMDKDDTKIESYKIDNTNDINTPEVKDNIELEPSQQTENSTNPEIPNALDTNEGSKKADPEVAATPVIGNETNVNNSAETKNNTKAGKTPGRRAHRAIYAEGYNSPYAYNPADDIIRQQYLNAQNERRAKDAKEKNDQLQKKNEELKQRLKNVQSRVYGQSSSPTPKKNNLRTPKDRK